MKLFLYISKSLILKYCLISVKKKRVNAIILSHMPAGTELHALGGVYIRTEALDIPNYRSTGEPCTKPVRPWVIPDVPLILFRWADK
jgi:hypothetical protein